MTGPEILRADEILKAYAWPGVTPSGTPKFGVNDTLVMCSGFEDRATWVLEQACSLGAGEFHLIHITYEPIETRNRVSVVEELVTNARLKENRVCYDRLHPSGIAFSVLENISKDGVIYLDISGMSRLLVVQLLVEFARAGYLSRSILLYCEPAIYYPTESEFIDGKACETRAPVSYISSGVYEVASTPELSSVAMQGESIRLIAFPSFNSDQLNALLMELLPTSIDLIYGKYEREDNKWREEAVKFCNDISLRSASNVDEYSAAVLDYRDTLRVVTNIYASHYVFDRILLAPTGTKLQSVAVAFVKMFLDDIQVVYPIPHEFKDTSRYTSGVNGLYSLDLSFLEEVRSVR